MGFASGKWNGYASNHGGKSPLKTIHQYRLGIVGATGAVGRELIHLVHDRGFPCSELQLLASARSAGRQIQQNGNSWTIRETRPDSFDELDVAIFSAGSDTTRRLAAEANRRNCVVIDNSSAYRMDPKVPLVVPEINSDALTRHKGIVANPNCTTAVALMGLYPLHCAFGLTRFFACTYQAVSGAGAAAMEELKTQVLQWSRNQPLTARVFPHQIAFNLLPQADAFQPGGYTKEELKMANESRKILDLPTLKVSTTCVRVPVFRTHSIAVHAEFEKAVDLAAAREAVQSFPGTILVDEPENQRYPMPIDFSGREACGVGRLRKDDAFDNGLAFWVVGDQLWKGAALNAIQIAEAMHERHILRI